MVPRSLRYRVPFEVSLIVLLTGLAIAGSVLWHDYPSLRSDAAQNAQRLARLLSQALAPDLKTQGTWQAYKTLMAVYRGAEPSWLLPAFVLVLDANGHTRVASDPVRFPLAQDPAGLGADRDLVLAQLPPSGIGLPQQLTGRGWVYRIEPVAEGEVVLGTLAVELLQQGARDYLTKPFEPDELLVKLRRACPALFERAETPGSKVLGVSPAIRRIEQVLERVARHRVPVLITGASGVGKEYAARYLHRCRNAGEPAPFLGLNCAAVPVDLIEVELFGAERGAFTGAVGMRPGMFEQAGSGTLFLDEVGDMPLAMQAKLLRAVQEHSVRRIGGAQDIAIQAQLVWATNCNLEERVAQGRFREDLYFRMSTVHVELPALRERPEDIVWFARKFLDAFARENGRHCFLTPRAERYLTGRPWTGNVRALKQAVDRAAIFSDSGVLEPDNFRPAGTMVPMPEDGPQAEGLKDYLAECEGWYIRRALERCGGRMGESAQLLGISRKSLWERMNRLGMGRDASEGSA